MSKFEFYPYELRQVYTLLCRLHPKDLTDQQNIDLNHLLSRLWNHFYNS